MEANFNIYYKAKMEMGRLKLIVFFGMILSAASLGKVSAQQVFKTTSTSTIAYYEYVPAD